MKENDIVSGRLVWVDESQKAVEFIPDNEGYQSFVIDEVNYNLRVPYDGIAVTLRGKPFYCIAKRKSLFTKFITWLRQRVR